MPDVKLFVEPEHHGVDVTDWVLRTGVAFFFLAFGAEKLFGSSWVGLFAEIGLGQWFRYVTGTLKVTGSLLLATPRTSAVGAAILACTMIGAIVVHVFVRADPFASLIPVVLLALIVAAGWKRVAVGRP